MSIEKVRTVNGTLLVVDDTKDTKSAGGIIIPETAGQEHVLTGQVISVSPFLLEDGRLMDPPISIGDNVIYGMHAGAGCTWKDDRDHRLYRFVKWNEILAVNIERKDEASK